MRLPSSVHSNLVIKEVGVNPLNDITVGRRDADAIIEHEFRQVLSVNQDDSAIEPIGIIPGILRETRSRDEDSLLGFRPMRGTDEFVKLGVPPYPCPIVCLDEEEVETELVLFDDAVNAAIPDLPMAFPASFREPPYPIVVRSRTSQSLEEVEGIGLHARRQIEFELLSKPPVTRVQEFLWRLA